MSTHLRSLPRYVLTAVALTCAVLVWMRPLPAAHAAPEWHYSLCASRALTSSQVGHIEHDVAKRLAMTRGISSVVVRRASSRCVAVRLSARVSPEHLVAAAGHVGNVVKVDGGGAGYCTGERVRVVCPRPECSPGVPVGTARFKAHPPILSVVMSARAVQAGTAQVGYDSAQRPIIRYALSGEGMRGFCAYVRAHPNHPYIVTVADGVIIDYVQADPTRCTLWRWWPIDPPLSLERAYELVGYLNTGPLPVALRLQH